MGAMDAKQRRTRDVEVTGLTADSRTVAPGNLFAALPGSLHDGRDHIPEAVARGAVVILAPDGTTLTTDAAVELLTDDNPRRRLAQMAARFHGPQPRHVTAVTGTNGKTSVVEFARQIWAELGEPAASLGTLGVQAPGFDAGPSLTTPDPVSLHRTLAALGDAGIARVTMEASSHGLDQYRLDGVVLEAAAFTNLGRDHLDYHAGLDAYLAAKARLFAELLPAGATAVLNADMPEFAALRQVCTDRGQRILSYGERGADLRLADWHASSDGQDLTLALAEREVAVHLPLIGRFQAMNALAALGLTLAGGAPRDAALAALKTLHGVRGRLERVATHPSGAAVLVDYAHTPDALVTALGALRPHVERRLVVVFGAGGDRDPGKRPLMGRAAYEHADRAIVTNDNPRTEDAGAIRAEVLAGCPGASEIGDRGAAIRAAVAELCTGDLLLIAGKGHETGQIVGDAVLPFDDAEVARATVVAVGGRPHGAAP